MQCSSVQVGYSTIISALCCQTASDDDDAGDDDHDADDDDGDSEDDGDTQ